MGLGCWEVEKGAGRAIWTWRSCGRVCPRLEIFLCFLLGRLNLESIRGFLAERRIYFPLQSVLRLYHDLLISFLPIFLRFLENV